MGYVEVSTRISIRWLPDPPSEPTETLVFNVGSYFLDLRVLKSNSSIDWAMAGERQVISTSPLKCRWIHHIDSNSAHAVPDEGQFSKLPNGDDLETGSMPCPERGGEVTPYEEVWRKISPSLGSDISWILQRVGGGKCWVGRIGGGFMVLQQGEKGFGARREEWDEASGEWTRKYELGDLEECLSMVNFGARVFDGEEAWKVGETVAVLGSDYLVKAFERLRSHE
ncbi:hypothetical protein B0O99DRAFT_594491 [Bisporella sp. PMI_857]|nr:hypothetical protein B0O99DRAFT_594491 [Bisporella sp. PMI_857]